MPGDPDLPEVVAPVRASLRIRGRSVAAAVVVVGLTLLTMRVLASAGRVLVWALISASSAALLSPAVDRVARRVPRGIAVAAVALAALASAGVVTYGMVDGVVRQTRALERRAPALAGELERDGRFASAAREAHLRERTERFVREVPERLRGGTPAEAIRSATTRGLAFLAVFVLTVFFLLHGPKLAAAAAAQVHDDGRRALIERVGAAVHRRAFGYARGTIAMAALAGGVAYAIARLAHVPAPAPLALWVALWDIVPLLGATVGAVPIVAFAGVNDPTRGLVVLVAFVVYQVVEDLVLQPRLERATVRLGPFLTAAGGFAGLELYGLSGALLAILGVAIAAVALDESTA